MEFGNSRRSRRRKIETEAPLNCPLQFYVKPPTGNVSLKEFDEMAIERLKSECFVMTSEVKDGMCPILEDN